MCSKERNDEALMAGLIAFTAKSRETETPVPFGALIVETATGKPLMQALNSVAAENDPSSHAELRTVRLATKKLKSRSLAGYTMYSTCEPCPMCMANALWAGLDRVVFGATIKDANRHCRQIQIPAKEVSRRSDMPCEIVGKVLADGVLRAVYSSEYVEGLRELERRQPQACEEREGMTEADVAELQAVRGGYGASGDESADRATALSRLLLVLAGAEEAARR